MDIGEVATPATRDANLFANAVRVFQKKDSAAASAGFSGTKKPGGSSSDYNDIAFAHGYHNA